MIRPNIKTIDNNTPASVSPELVPEIIWPSVQSESRKKTCFDSSTCPTLEDVHEKSWGDYECITFWKQVVNSKRILILDRYFDFFACDLLYKSIEIAKNEHLIFDEIKILYSNQQKTEEKKLELQKRINETKILINLDGKLTFKVKELSYSNAKVLHDRFAVTDKEIWHFGANVGGGHRSFNAVSRGWDDGKLKFSTFFFKVWRDTR